MRSRTTVKVVAITSALVATVVGWQQAVGLKFPSPIKMAIWSPSIVILNAREVAFFLLALLQFPAIATGFILATRRWPVARVLTVTIVLYAAAVAAALVVISKSSRW